MEKSSTSRRGELKIKQCSFCGATPNAPLQQCGVLSGGCGQRQYCNAACQKSDWKEGHRLVCIKMRQVFSPPDNKQSTWSDGGDTEKREGTRSGSAAPTAATTCGAMDPPMPPPSSAAPTISISNLSQFRVLKTLHATG